MKTEKAQGWNAIASSQGVISSREVEEGCTVGLETQIRRVLLSVVTFQRM